MRVAMGGAMVRRKSYDKLLERLSASSVEKHFDAYADLDWDAKENAIRKDDLRFVLDPSDSLGATEWYQCLPPSLQAELGLTMVAQQAKVGLLFENVLSRGLLEFAAVQPDDSPEFRYAYHEVIEESQHTLMFREFIRRARVQVPGLSGFHAWAARMVPPLGRTFPEMFFMFVLGGEGPIDHVQRKELSKGKERHPMLERIMQIHVLEEARHICFAKHFLFERTPRLSAWKMFQLRMRTPILLQQMAKLMMEPPREIIDRFAIPRVVLREAYGENPAHRQALLDGVEKIREICLDLRIVTPSMVWMWQRLGIWPSVPHLLPAGG